MRRFAVAVAVVVTLLLVGTARAEEAVEPVDSVKLLPFLPEKVDGYVAEKPQGSTSTAMGFQLTEVSRVYHKGSEDADETVTVKLTDGAGNQFFTAAHAAVGKFKTENADGYEKGLKLDGFPAIERYTNESRDGSLTVFVADRYLVEIDIDGLDSKEMQVWWKRLDARKLAALKDS
jgi:hypothetical protein